MQCAHGTVFCCGESESRIVIRGTVVLQCAIVVHVATVCSVCYYCTVRCARVSLAVVRFLIAQPLVQY